MRPIIGITSNYGERAGGPRPRLYLDSDYADAVYAAGGVPRLIAVPPINGAPPSPAAGIGSLRDPDLDELLRGLDGVMFTGGYDLHPRHYGAAPHPRTEVLAERRDAFEVAFFRRADAARVPILAICLGIQTAWVARGGGLIQHVDDGAAAVRVRHHTPTDEPIEHLVRIEAGSRLAEVLGATEISVNSRHHQAVDAGRPGRELRPVAWAPDGLLEAAEDFSDGRFLLAVQWHPENLHRRLEHGALFRALVAAARVG